MSQLLGVAGQLEVSNTQYMYKQKLMFAVLKKEAKQGETIFGGGTLEVLPDGFGFLRSPETSYLTSTDNIYIGPSWICWFSLHTNNTIEGEVRTPKDDGRYFALVKVDKVNTQPPEAVKNHIIFRNLTPLHPNRPLTFERDIKAEGNITGHIIDMITPIGRGQRALLVASPKSGEIAILQHVARAIATNHPEAELLVLLIDERPEEVTEMQHTVRGEVVASTFDKLAAHHVQVVEMIIRRAKRLVELEKDVVIMLDSITRLARTYSTVVPTSGKVLTGGVNTNALQCPKRFFGMTRNLEEGGSLAIIGTALIKTDSRMDDMIYGEFKNTGNVEMRLERRLTEKRVYPAINPNKSGTCREGLLIKSDILQGAWILCKFIHDMGEVEAVEFLLDKLEATKDNAEFFDMMRHDD